MKFQVKLKSIGFAFIFVLAVSCDKDNDDVYVPIMAEEGEALSGGETTVFDSSTNSFGFQAPNLTGDNELFFFTGNSLFNQNWVTAPASTTARDGLGPFFNARACSTCHFRDGRGRAPISESELNHGLLLRLSVPGQNENGENNPEPTYGGQLQDQSILNAETEGRFKVSYSNKQVKYPDGTSIMLRVPNYTFANLQYGEMASNVEVSPRVANQMVGLGLLEAIPESTLLDFAEEQNENSSSISGRPNYVWNVETQKMAIGRFGWKANQPSIKQQVAAAFSGDLGITTSLFSVENCPTGVNCNDFVTGGNPELSDENLNKVVLYSSVLAVPARRNVDSQEVLEGKVLFNTIDCVGCHISKTKTGTHAIPALENQTIRPYTDLLLHDMGDALADHRPDFKATGNEWRTPPLWGIGLINTVNGHSNLLHDGRARNIEEAILWHGGEAENSKLAFMSLSAIERSKIIQFIETL